MKLVLAVGTACAIVFATLFFSLSCISSDPSTADLDADLSEVQISIKEAENEAALYSGGAILALIQIRIETLKTTQAMLEQKRNSLLRRINLSYVIEGVAHIPNTEIIAALEEDIAGAQKERDRNMAEAARYSGGLIQTMALMNAATSEVTIGQLRLSLLAEKYGFVFGGTSAQEPNAPVGQVIVTEDSEAL
ncbi:hypothetical protein [Devosia sp. Root635]|uniref:hypothetical protein n=1 Tax=Devosia sp. Root635 TaxID=1736575 RepID=UPI0006F8C743|nr:hypothetical protein [Devosia sp. Root635]KRA45645.1 hypothetical protein ASD80_04765 [Devosia sp. Root635]